MKTITAVALMTMGLAASGLAAEYKGFVEDTKCSTMPEMKGDAACAQKCIKGGSPAVLVTPEGKIYKIANQDKIVERLLSITGEDAQSIDRKYQGYWTGRLQVRFIVVGLVDKRSSGDHAQCGQSVRMRADDQVCAPHKRIDRFEPLRCA